MIAMIILARPRKNSMTPNTNTLLKGKLVCIFHCSDIFVLMIYFAILNNAAFSSAVIIIL